MMKLGGKLRYLDLGPGEPRSITNYTVGGRSVHAQDASSGLSKNTLRDMRPPRRAPGDAGKAQPFVIKRRPLPLPVDQE